MNDGTDGHLENCATFLIEYQLECGYACEVDLFVAQAVLQLLASHKPPVAQSLFDAYTLHHPRIPGISSCPLLPPSNPSDPLDGPPYESPLLNFVWLLLLSVELKRLQEFTLLLEHYKPSIDRDPAYIDYLHKVPSTLDPPVSSPERPVTVQIGEVYFGVPPPARAPAGGNFLANLFSSPPSLPESVDRAKEASLAAGMLKDGDESSEEGETPPATPAPSRPTARMVDSSELD